MSITGILKRISDSSIISISPNELNIPAIGGEYELEIDSDTSWVITTIPDHVTISSIRGFQNHKIRLTFDRNNDLINSRVGEIIFTDSLGNRQSVHFTQDPAELTYEYTLLATSNINFINTGESKDINLQSYKTAYLWDEVYEDAILLDCFISVSDDWIIADTTKATVLENTINSIRTGSIQITQVESNKIITVYITQNAADYTYKYSIGNIDPITLSAAPETKLIPIIVEAEHYINGNATGNIYNVTSFSSISDSSFITTKDESSVITIEASNNMTILPRSGNVTVTPTAIYSPIEGTLPTKTFVVSQNAGSKVYSDITANLTYNTITDASGGSCNPTISYSQNYTWNGVDDSIESVLDNDFTVTYSIPETNDALIDQSSGIVTWTNNESLSSRTINVTAIVYGAGNKSIVLTSPCNQNAGYYTYGDIIIDTFVYSSVSAVGGQSSPSIIYHQSYGWNGLTSGIGVVNGNGDDIYTTYHISSAQTGLSIDPDTGVITWETNNATYGTIDPERHGEVTATVIRNGKTVTKTVIVIQNEEVVSNYTDWSFSIIPSLMNIPANGGETIITLSRPTRNVIYDTGDITTETATSGSFELTRSNEIFSLSTDTVLMTRDSLPTFTLSVPSADSDETVINSTVTAVFTASDPVTGNITTSKTSNKIYRQSTEIIRTEYRFSTFSLNNTAFTAKSDSTILSIILERRDVYTGDIPGDWIVITPEIGSLSIISENGCSIGNISYGETSTCVITVDAYTNTLEDRTILITGNYNSGQAIGNISITQTKDVATTVEYGIPTINTFNYTSFPAKGATYTPNLTYSQSRIQNYVSGNTVMLSNVTSGATAVYTLTAAEGFTLNDTSTGSLTANSRGTIYGSSSRTARVSVLITMNGKTSSSKTCTASQKANTITVGTITVSAGKITAPPTYSAKEETQTITNDEAATGSAQLIFSSGSKISASTSYGTWSTTYSWSSNQNYATLTSSNSLSIDVTMMSRGTTYSATTRSATITRSASMNFTLKSTYGSKSGTVSSASANTTIAQAANTITIDSVSDTGGSLEGYDDFVAGESTISLTAIESSSTAILTFSSGNTINTTYNSTTYGSWTHHGYTATSDQTYANINSATANEVSVTMLSRGNVYGESTRSAIITRLSGGFTFTLKTEYGGSSKKSPTGSCSCTITQAANIKSVYSYGDIIPLLSYPTDANAESGATQSPTLGGSQFVEYRWSSGSYGGSEYIDLIAGTFSMSTSNSNASVNPNTGVVTWTSANSGNRRSVDITRSVTQNGKTGTVSATAYQSEGSRVTNTITIVYNLVYNQVEIHSTYIPASELTCNITIAGLYGYYHYSLIKDTYSTNTIYVLGKDIDWDPSESVDNVWINSVNPARDARYNYAIG